MFNMTPYARKRNTMSYYDPFRELEDMQKYFWGDSSLSAFKTDIRDNGKEFILEADLPGFRKEDIHVDVEDNTLTITAERHSDYEQKDKQGNFVKCERSYGSFTRSFDVTGIRQDDVKAKYDNGVLRLTLPKQEEIRPASKRLTID